MRNRHIGFGKPPDRRRPGNLLNGPPPGVTGSVPEEEARRRALLFMLEDLEEDRHKIEQARREWTKAFDAIRDPVFIHDANYNVVRANRAYAERAGSDFTGILGRPYWEVFPRGTGPLPHCRIATEDKHDSVTEEFALDTGETFISRAFVMRDAGKHFLYAIHVLEDITEQRKADAERRILSEALRQSAAGLILLNSDLSFRYANPAACDLVGYGPGQLDGLPMATVVPEGLRERTPAIKAAVDATGLWTGEVTLAALDGTLIPAYLSASTITDASGKALAYVGSWLDLRPIKQAQAALAASEARFRLLTENLSDLVAVVAADGGLLYVSQSVQRLLGHTPDEIAGHNMSEFLHPEDIAPAQAKIAQSIADPAAIQRQIHRLRHKDGSWRYFETLGRNLLHEPAVGGIVLNSRDITERKLVEQALAESEAKFRSISATALDAVLMIDNVGRLAYWNPAAERIFGHKAEEVLGRDIHRVLAPSRYHATIERGFASFRETGDGPVIGKTLELEALRKDGSEFPVELSISALRLNDRWHAVGIVRDITRRKRAEEALRESEEKFRALVETTTDWIWQIDEHGVYTYASPQVRDILGYEPEEIVGKTPFDLMSPSEAERMSEIFKSLVASHKPFRLLENANFGKDGRMVVLETSGTPLFDRAGVYKGCRGIDRDVTARKRAEEEVRRQRDTAQRYLDIAGVMLVALDTDGNVALINRKGCELLGYREEEIVGQSWFDRFLPDHFREDTRKVFEQILAGKLQLTEFYENPVLTRGGAERVIAWHNRVLTDGTGKIAGTLSSGEDVTERKQMEGALRRSNRALRAISAGNALLIHAGDETGLLHDMCRVIVEEGAYRLAWVGYMEDNAAKGIRAVAHAGLGPGELETLKITWTDLERGCGPISRAVWEGQPQFAQDIRNDPGFAPWRQEAAKYGYASMIALPLKRNSGEAFGTLNIYSTEANAFDAEEIRLLTEMAEDLAFGILTLRARTEHERLQEAHLRTAEQLKETLTDTIRAIALTVEKRDPYTAGHQHKVADLCAAIAQELKLPEDRIEGMRLGATIHDIGKVYVPAEILNRPGRLSDAEFEIIKSHPEVGYDIIKDVKFPWPVAETIRQHHEHLDGSGYPHGLKGEAIILEARILTVADVVEAMSSHRPYRPALGGEAGLAEIERHRGTWYDPAVVDACLRLFREKRFAFD